MTSPEATFGEQAASRRQLLTGATLVVAATALEACSFGNKDEKPGEPISPHISMETQEIRSKTDLLRTGSWEHMAGAQLTTEGLVLAPTGLAIVNKRENNRIDPDPPLNIYGSRLQTSGDFAIGATIQSEKPVSIQFYGEPPLRFDDFRVEHSRVECLAAGNTLSVRIWDGSRQEPAAVHNFPFSGSVTNRQIEMRREGNELTFMVNGKQVGGLLRGDVFQTGEVWLGLNSEQGRALVTAVTAQPLNGHKLELIDTRTLHVTEPLPDGLQSLVRKPGFRLGAAAALNPMVSDPQYAQLLLGGEVGSLTTENALKPQNTQPLKNVFTFEEGDAVVELAARHGVAVHGHTLVYHRAMPKWMQELPTETEADKQRVREVLEQHIKTVVGHYKGRIASWDVVNEAITGFNNNARLEESIWFKALGEEYIDIAFRAAHAADPDAKLFINDFGLETNPQGRGVFMFDLVRRLISRGVPIHGIGIQGHVYEMSRDTVKPDKLRDLMRTGEELGLEIRVTELDVTGENGADAQAKQYADVLKVCLEAPNCTGLTIWGLDDLHGSTAGIKDGKLRPGNALPYTADYRPKQARRAMADVLS